MHWCCVRAVPLHGDALASVMFVERGLDEYLVSVEIVVYL